MFSDLLQQQAGYYFELIHHLEGCDETVVALQEAETHYQALDGQLKAQHQVYQKIEQETKKAYDHYRRSPHSNEMYRHLFQGAQKEKLAYECLFHAFSIATIKKYDLASQLKAYQPYQHQLESWLEQIFKEPHEETDQEAHLVTKINELTLKREKLIIHLLGDIARAKETFTLAKTELDAAIQALDATSPCTSVIHLRRFQAHVACDYYDSSVYSNAVAKLMDKISTGRKDQTWHSQLIKLQVQFADRLETINKTIQAYDHASLRHVDKKLAKTKYRLMQERQRIVDQCLAGESTLHPLTMPAYHSDFSPPAYTTTLNMPRFLPLLEDE